MVVFTGQPVTALVPGGSSSGWTPQTVEQVIDKVLSMVKTVQSLRAAQGAGQQETHVKDSPMIIHSDPPAAKCKVEAGLENLYALTSNLVNGGQGDTKLSSLLDINSLTIRDAQQFIGKVIGR
jgi:hypothetical protein